MKGRTPNFEKQAADARPSKVRYRDSQEGWNVTKTMAAIKPAQDEDTPFFAVARFPKPGGSGRTANQYALNKE